MYLAVLFLLFLYTATSADAIRCLQCDGVLTPLLCDRIANCQRNEICFAEKYITTNKEELYNVGCFSNASCIATTIAHPQIGHLHLVTNHNANDVLQCSYCCDTDICNQKSWCTVQLILIPTTIGAASCLPESSTNDINVKHGPICFDCHQTQNPGTCSFVKTCEQNEVCSLQEMTRLGIHFYSLSCVSNSDCEGHHGTIFGKRRRQDELTHCCNADLCNQDPAGMSKPADCSTIKHYGIHKSGVYTIYPGKRGPVQVYCDMTTSGGGWTIIHSRINNTLHSNRSWDEYKTGFGNANGDYWIGKVCTKIRNDYIHLLTLNRSSEVYFKLQSYNLTWNYAMYRGFAVGPESDGYRLAYNGTTFRGNAGDALHVCSGYTDYHDGLKFSTYDRNNDKSYFNCAGEHGGGWWYNNCELVVLTATRGNYRWFCDLRENIKASVMMIRPST